MANVKGLRVQISHKKEYLATDEEQLDGVITKYIEAGSGQNFSIHWSFEECFPFKDTHIMSSVCLDGKYVDCVAFAPENMSKPEGFTLYGARVMKDEKWYQLPFSFADLKIDEDNHGINDTGLKEKVGSLDISVKTWDTRYIDPMDKPFQVFNFRYRSRSGLQALGLIPRTPEPARRPMKRRQEAQQDVDPQIKPEFDVKREREGSDEENGAERKSKRQRGSHVFEDVETIDLTGV
ncbi:hypothetical protein UCDDS831_g03130 [Diplodia seriata]|uniref:DUF7918 domain-containing protein n=1 Tax=Diplodia seriata TaxID=420778 RepID=A0A0G2EM67_9PEZI|nr:hypothetical protein UCDDS831_g03130 [Diplodia seriata]